VLKPPPAGRAPARAARRRRAPGGSRADGRGLPPPRPAGLVPRARLLRRLQEARDVPLVLLVAPAGYGKTTVLSEWAQQDPRPFRWLRADDPRATLAVLADEAAIAQHPFVLVLDDAHMLRDADAGNVLEAIVDGMPPGSQLALAARCEPALAVGRLRAHRQVVELRTADLAMERAEAAALLAKAGLRLGTEDLDALVRRTEGWPAGLYLAALSLRDQPDVRGAVKRFAGDDHVVAEYLRDELLSPLSTDRIAFLVRTSVLDILSASACDAVLEDTGSGHTLVELARSNSMLLSVDRSGDSYRHHGLFAEMLRAELRHADPDLEAELHRRASAWHMAGGDTHSAIRHLVAAGDLHAATELMWVHAPGLIAKGGKDTVRRWLDGFTGEQATAHAPLALVAATYWLAAGDGRQAERWTTEAERSLGIATGETWDALHAALTILRASTAPDGVPRMGCDAAAAGNSEPDHSPWRRAARLLEGVSHLLTGHRGDARLQLEEGGRGGASAAPNIQALCLAQLALLALDDEDWDEAAIVTARARSQVKASGLGDYPTMSLVFAVSGLVRARRGMVEEAREDVLSSTRLLGQLVDFAPWYEAETRIVLARALLRLGDVAAARTLMTTAAHILRDIPESTTLRTWLEETRAHLDAATRSASENWALTPAELRVLQLLPTHLSLAAIARRLYVSPNTVKTHAQAVYRKLDASSRGEAVGHAYAAGLLHDVEAA
jgi:LuxR family transcriptional regulator, maltose regulon positive regulatory protein